MSSQIRADLVRLGHVQEQGVRLGMQGTFAGVGNLVQTRANAWHLAGVEGNRRGPMNRETYRVLDRRDDGGLQVARITGRGPDGEILNAALMLPADYVAEHVALGYAATVMAARSRHVRAVARRWCPERVWWASQQC